MKKDIYIKGLLHHHYRFSFRKNIKVWFCRTFGHEKNTNKDNKWCERCGLSDDDIYNRAVRENKPSLSKIDCSGLGRGIMINRQLSVEIPEPPKYRKLPDN